MAEPLVSVIMGVLYRREDLSLLKRSVESILAQDCTDFEFLICDNGSTDEASAYLQRMADLDERIRLIRREGAITLPQKLNECHAHARGRYIARMDDDDYSHPERFRLQMMALDAHEEIAFVGCNVNLCCEGAPAQPTSLPHEPTPKDFLWVQPFVHPTLLFRKEALDAVGGYSLDKRCLLCEDYDLLLRLYAKGLRGMNLKACLLDYSYDAKHAHNRKMRHRLNEVATRFRRYRELGLLPGAWPYVIKPVAVGLIPGSLIAALRRIMKRGWT